jgi:HPt (histidine-containing phosphotransfer) domain-containing protein
MFRGVNKHVPPIDIEEFRAQMRAAGIEEIVVPMLQLFGQEAPKGMDALVAAMKAGDLDAASRAAHSLKSSAGNVRATTLADTLQALEHAAAGKNGSQAAAHFESAKVAYDAVVKQLGEYGIAP